MVDIPTCEAAAPYFRVLKRCMAIEFGKAWNIS
jgi:uncharacterized protein (DUF736 family)